MPRHWTVAEAQAALPEVQALIHKAQAADAKIREARAQLEDLRVMYNDDAEQQSDYGVWLANHAAAREELEAILLKCVAMGIEVKDYSLGLVDFRTMLGDQEVFLCWKDGETSVAHWHSVDGGYARRQPIPDFNPVT